MAIAATIAVDIVARTEAFQQAMSGLSTRLKNTGQSIENTGKALTTAFTIPLAAASAGIYQAVQAAADLEETQNAVRVTFGEAADQINAFAESSARSLGQSQTEALRAAQSFGMFANAAGLSGEETVKFSTDLVRLATDFASIQNTSPEDAILAIGAALRGEAEPIRRFNVLLDEYTLKQKAMELGIIETTKNALTPQQKILAAHALIMEQGTYAMGDFGRTSEGLANQQRILKAELADVSARLGQAFLPIANSIVGVLRSSFVPLIESLARGLKDVPTPVLAGATAFGAMLAVIGPLLVVMGSMIQAAGTVSGSLASMAGVIKDRVIPSMKTMFTMMRANPIGIVITALGALAAAFIYVYRNSETFRGMFSGIVDALTGMAKAIMDSVMPVLEALVNIVVNVFGSVTDIIRPFVNFVTTAFRAVLPAGVAEGMAQFHANLTGGVRGAIDQAKQIITELRAPSLDLGVTGSNRAAIDALYGPIMEASNIAGTNLTVDFDKARAAVDRNTQAVEKAELALIPMEQAMQGNIQAMQSEARVIMDSEDRRKALNEYLSRNSELLKESNDGFVRLHQIQRIYSAATDIAKRRMEGLGASAMDVISKFTPMGIIAEILGAAFDSLRPVLDALIEPMKIIGLVLGKALASILRALFPIIKMIAIAFTYAGQIFFKVAELIAKAIGYAVKGIGKAIDALPLISAKGIIRAGEGLIALGDSFGDTFDELGRAREEIRGLELPDAEQEANALAKQSTDANKQTAENTARIAALLEAQREANRPVQVVINTSGAGGAQEANEIARQLDDYFGRNIVYEERAVGRVNSFIP